MCESETPAKIYKPWILHVWGQRERHDKSERVGGCASQCVGGCASLLSNKSSPPGGEEESEDEDADKQPCKTGGKTKAMIGGAVIIPGGKVSGFSQGVERARDTIWKKGRRGEERERKGENERSAMQYSQNRKQTSEQKPGGHQANTEPKAALPNTPQSNNPPTKDVKRAQQHIRVSHDNPPNPTHENNRISSTKDVK
ncbi:hypothetical protein ARMSODRAFT_970332 [Armillaria solidipes]|uniref:Uncharacterized protein n=1 Tax=Armillaria solidipes TaxID=1076256 RepID=A0A2H3CI05_9AGAR|nr:hypothetical protein ARMSODRAFT_970332 [Armillaria solidipes]